MRDKWFRRMFGTDEATKRRMQAQIAKRRSNVEIEAQIHETRQALLNSQMKQAKLRNRWGADVDDLPYRLRK